MNCEPCGDKGIIRLNWSDASEDYAVCLCEAGQRWRCSENAGKKVSPMWLLWCSWNQVDPLRVFMVEDVLTDEEMQERGLSVQPVSLASEAALLAAGRTQRGKL